MDYLIAPSLLSADITRLGEEVQALMDAGADYLHFDVMDNHYVPNLTFGPLVCEQLTQRFKNLALDIHLMTHPVDDLIERFAKAGAKRISIHPDATTHLDRSLQKIRDLGCKAGLVLNPATSPEYLYWCVHRLDFVLVMTVNPGFGGQKLIPEMVKKISIIKQVYPLLPICVDGGVNPNNIVSLAEAGASEFVMGAAFFAEKDYQKTIQTIRHQLKHL